jgi:hypothetical protein
MAGLVFERDVYLAAEPNDNELVRRRRCRRLNDLTLILLHFTSTRNAYEPK